MLPIVMIRPPSFISPATFLGREEGRAHIDGEYAVEGAVGVILERPGHGQAGIVDQDVDAAEAREGRLDRAQKSGRVGDVRPGHRHLGPGRLKLGGEARRLIGSDRDGSWRPMRRRRPSAG